jgi:ribonuclease P protein component
LGRGPDLQSCWNTGKRVRLPHLELAWLPRPNPGRSRSGIIVPLYQRTAVQRNQLRRRIREILRRETLRLLPPVDLVVRARREAYAATFAVLRDELAQAVTKIK